VLGEKNQRGREKGDTIETGRARAGELTGVGGTLRKTKEPSLRANGCPGIRTKQDRNEEGEKGGALESRGKRTGPSPHPAEKRGEKSVALVRVVF